MKITVISQRPLARLVELEPSDLHFSYDAGDPTWSTSPAFKDYGNRERVDPWGPCYTHDPKLCADLLEQCVEVVPLGPIPVTVHLACYEGLSRTNGWASQQHVYYDDELTASWKGPGKKPWEGVIVLNGRRIEIHPAVTRYVLPHEYGHLVEDALSAIRYPDDKGTNRELREEFAKMRGLRTDLPYGPGTHHLVPGEVFANDFRAFILEREREFWPHPVRPAWQLKRVQRWWQKALDDLATLSL